MQCARRRYGDSQDAARQDPATKDFAKPSVENVVLWPVICVNFEASEAELPETPREGTGARENLDEGLATMSAGLLKASSKGPL